MRHCPLGIQPGLQEGPWQGVTALPTTPPVHQGSDSLYCKGANKITLSSYLTFRKIWCDLPQARFLQPRNLLRDPPSLGCSLLQGVRGTRVGGQWGCIALALPF